MSQRPHIRTSVTPLHTVLGVLTILVFLGVGYVSFTANSGLPFHSTYDVSVDVPDADRITKSDEVRIDGVRVGQVQDVTAIAPRGAQPFAQLKLALQPSIGPVPVNTTVSIGQASILGDADVDLVPGNSTQTLPSGGRLPLTQAEPTVQLTDLLDIFDRGTARGIQGSLGGLAPGLAGRGAATNDTIGSLSRLVGPLQVISATLSDPSTRLHQFISGFEQLTAAFDPVREQLAQGFSNGGTTFGTIAAHSGSLAGTIEALPATEAAVTSGFTKLQPALSGLAHIATQLVAPSRLLPVALQNTNTTLRAGLMPLAQLPRFASALEATFARLESTVAHPTVPGAVRQLADLFTAAKPFLSSFESAQVHCNTLGLWGTNFGGLWTNTGFAGGPNVIVVTIRTLGAEGELLQHAAPSPNAANNLIAENDGHECQSGNEPYTGTLAIGDPAGASSDHTRSSAPPQGVASLARKAGLLDVPEGRQ